MKVNRLSIKNFLGIEDLEIEPGGKSQRISGGNARGKTSILKALQVAIDGSTDATVIRRPGGATTIDAAAEILVELDEISIERAISGDGKQSLEVRTVPDGVKISKPQTYLRELSNALLFNPVSFFFQTSKEKRETLLRVMPLRTSPEEVRQALLEHPAAMALRMGDEFEPEKEFHRFMSTNPEARRADFGRHAFDVLAQLYKAAYDMRHAIGQEVKTKRAILEGAGVAAPAVPYDAAEHEQLVEQLNAAAKLRARRETNEREKANALRMIDDLEAQLATARSMLESAERNLAEIDEDPAADIDEHGLRNRVFALQNAKAVHESHEQAMQKLGKVKDEEAALAKRREIYQIACEVFERDLPKRKLAEARVPVEGLEITPEGLTVGGVAIEHLSGAEQMKVAIAIAEAAIPAGGMAVLCIDGAERLDGEQFAVLEERLGRGDLQGFVTRVTSGERVIETIEAPV